MLTNVHSSILLLTFQAHVINYDLPKSTEDYVHRIGRTGRIGNPGLASSFYDPEYDHYIVRDLVKVLVDSNQEVPTWLEKERETQALRGNYGGFGGYLGRDIRQQAKNDANYNIFAVRASQPLEEDELWD